MVLKGEHGRLGLIVLVKWANSEPLWNGWSKGVGRKRSFIWVFLAATLDLAEELDEVQCLVDNGKSAALCLVHF
ncbi:unnamed protein product [Peronospora belbahrii]|uniref:Uncharacterized protein n=1 Tax=Peronospora belbahrii TaxID=622444 RepID=A0ABN8CPN5_9STRA|nr:unnamed protein product [Peronospora belbahrii]